MNHKQTGIMEDRQTVKRRQTDRQTNNNDLLIDIENRLTD